jgi:hypothetical protein
MFIPAETGEWIRDEPVTGEPEPARYGGPWIALRALRHAVWERVAPRLGPLYDRVESRQLRAQLRPAARDGD